MDLYVRPRYLRSLLAGVGIFVFVTASTQAQFRFNFSASGGAVVGSIANQTCGGGGGMGGGNGACDGTPFIQEVVSIGGANYYHVVVGNGSGEFGIEYYMRTSGMCWYGCAAARVGGGMGGGMGGAAPFSSSAGPATNDSDPLGNAGTGAPDRVAIRQFNNTAQMTQEFLKSTESQKPKITQSLNTTGMAMDFSIDMSNSNYSTMDTPGVIALTQSVEGTDIPAPGINPATGQPFQSSANFNIDNIGPTAVKEYTGGRFTYSPGAGDGGSMGTYSYFADTYDVYNVDWQSFCVPSQNPASNCTNYGGVRGMGGGGMPASAGGPTTTASAIRFAPPLVSGSSANKAMAIDKTNASGVAPSVAPSFVTLPTVPIIQPAVITPANPFASAQSTNTGSSNVGLTSSTARRLSSTTRSSVTSSTVTTRFVR